MKTFQLNGKLSEGALKYRPLKNEFQTNDWNIKILSVAFISQTNEEINEVITISCNFVTGEMYSASEELITYEQPVQMFQLKLTQTNKKTAFRNQFYKTFTLISQP